MYSTTYRVNVSVWSSLHCLIHVVPCWFRWFSCQLGENAHAADKERSDLVDLHCTKVVQLKHTVSEMRTLSTAFQRTSSSLWSSLERPSRLFACRASRMSLSNVRILSGFCKSSDALENSMCQSMFSQNHDEWLLTRLTKSLRSLRSGRASR